MSTAFELISLRLGQTISNFTALLSNDTAVKQIAEVAKAISEAMKSGNKIMICGNGGSAGDAQHMAGEFVCRFYKDREPLAAIALSTDTSIITAISNDYSYHGIYSRQVKGLGKKGDILLGISTSGTSMNVLNAFEEARKLGITTILLTGSMENHGAVSGHCDIVLHAPSTETPRIQEMHLIIEHMICELVEQDLFAND